MKLLFITIGLIVLLSLASKSQPLSNDTVVCIIDTTKCYVKYRENPFANRNPKFHWQVSIKGHYYDITKPKNKDFASIVFNTNNLSSYYPDYTGPWQIKIPKGKIKDRFIIETDEWINKQTDFGALAGRIGSFPRDKCNFIVWKQDFKNANTDSVIMHRVTVGYREM